MFLCWITFCLVIPKNERVLSQGDKMTKKKDLTVFSALKYLSGFYKNMGHKFALFYFGRLVTMLEEITVPILIGLMINLVVYRSDFKLFLCVSGVLVGICIFSCIAYYFVYEIYSDFWSEIVERIRKKTYSIVLHMDAQAMSQSNYGDLAQQVQWKVMECVQLVVKNVIHNINNIFHIIICVFLLMRIDILVGIVVVVLLPISGYVSWTCGKRIRKQRNRNQQEYGTYINWLYEVISNYKNIRLLNAEKRVKKKLISHQEELIRTDVKAGIETVVAENIIKNVDVWIQMALYVVLAVLSVKKGLTIGTITVVLSYYATMKISVMVIVTDYFAIQNRLAIIKRIKDLLELPVEQESDNAKDIDFDKVDIEFRDVTFAYKDKEPVLSNLSFKISHGQKLALVGESGCGKSTIAYLLLGFYKPQSGEILIDGRPIEEYSLASLRRNIGIVQQETFIFNGTVRDNIIMGNKEITEEMLVRACKAAGVYDFVMEMEDKFETMLGKNARQLSGGQKQRIAIARVYLKNPKLIIFDEATASLDEETEAMVHANWKDIVEDSTAIVIAHRKSAVMMCEQVNLMQNGKISETGTPKQMEEDSIAFKTLFAVQQGGEL